MSSELIDRLEQALVARNELLEPPHNGALRLLNGYTEGFPGIAIDLYGTTLVISDALSATGDRQLVDEAVQCIRKSLPWVNTALWKIRESKSVSLRNGTLIWGTENQITKKIVEHGVWYAIRLTQNRDCSLYLDTRLLRRWAIEHLAHKLVLNLFAYTGSLGVAARAAPATRIVQTDLNKAFLNIAKDSYALNGWPISRADFITGNFFDVIGRLKREKAVFDCVFVDPPFLSVTEQGRVDIQEGMERLINKVRPLVANNGHLIVINNAVFTSGANFMATINQLCSGSYMTLDSLISVPDDFAGYETTRQGALPVDPAPFNHSTKIVILKVARKDEKRSV